MTLSKDQLLKIYQNMVRTRTLDYQMIKNARTGKMIPGWHSGLGEEVISGPVSLLRNDDYVTYTHRGAYAWIAKGIAMKEILAEFYGKSTGCAHGKGGTHITRPSLGIFGRSGMQGGHFPLAAGMGIAAQLRGQGQVDFRAAGRDDRVGTIITRDQVGPGARISQFAGELPLDGRHLLPREQQRAGPVRPLQGHGPGHRGFQTVGGPEDVQVGDHPQRERVLDRLVRRPVLADEHGVVREYVDRG